MRVRLVDRAILAVVAFILTVIGAGAAFVPAAFYASYDIEVDGLPELASELRGAGAALLVLGLATAAGAVWTRWTFTSAVIALIVSGGYALGRGVSAIADGVPNESVVIAGIAELVMAVAALWVVVRTRPKG